MDDSRNPSPVASPRDRGGIVLGPVMSAVLVACVVIGTMASLGVDWPRWPLAGLPLGAWVVMGVGVVVKILHRVSLRHGRGVVGALKRRLESRAGRFVAGIVRAADRFPERFRGGRHTTRGIESRLCEWLDRRGWASGSLSVGLDLPEDLGERLRVTAGLWPVAWTAVACPDGREQGLCRGKGLDAVVHVDARGRLVVTCRESPQRESAWRDWSVPEPLAYSSVFPFRVDATRATLAPLEEIGDGDLALLRLVVESLAAGGRIPERLTLEDRLLGRRVAFDPDGSGRRGDETSLHHMAREAIFEGVHREVRAVALRVASAWLAMRDDVDTDLRLRVAQAAADALPQEPGVLLRLVAARFAALDDAGGFDAVIQAYRLIRGSCPHPIFDHLAFLQSEVDHGLATPTTLGRVAAGICLVCASTTPDRLGFLRDDILDDLRYSGWLVGRDQDRAVLLEVFRVLERLEGRGMLRMAA